MPLHDAGLASSVVFNFMASVLAILIASALQPAETKQLSFRHRIGSNDAAAAPPLVVELCVSKAKSSVAGVAGPGAATAGRAGSAGLASTAVVTSDALKSVL